MKLPKLAPSTMRNAVLAHQADRRGVGPSFCCCPIDTPLDCNGMDYDTRQLCKPPKAGGCQAWGPSYVPCGNSYCPRSSG